MEVLCFSKNHFIAERIKQRKQSYFVYSQMIGLLFYLHWHKLEGAYLVSALIKLSEMNQLENLYVKELTTLIIYDNIFFYTI